MRQRPTYITASQFNKKSLNIAGRFFKIIILDRKVTRTFYHTVINYSCEMQCHRKKISLERARSFPSRESRERKNTNYHLDYATHRFFRWLYLVNRLCSSPAVIKRDNVFRESFFLTQMTKTKTDWIFRCLRDREKRKERERKANGLFCWTLTNLSLNARHS